MSSSHRYRVSSVYLVPQEALGETEKGIDEYPRAVSASASMYGAQARMEPSDIKHGEGRVGMKVGEKCQENGGLSTSDPGTA